MQRRHRARAACRHVTELTHLVRTLCCSSSVLRLRRYVIRGSETGPCACLHFRSPASLSRRHALAARTPRPGASTTHRPPNQRAQRRNILPSPARRTNHRFVASRWAKVPPRARGQTCRPSDESTTMCGARPLAPFDANTLPPRKPRAHIGPSTAVTTCTVHELAPPSRSLLTVYAAD